MAIPKRPMNFDPARLTIDQTIMLADFARRKQVDIGAIAALKALLVECTDWTAEEIGQIRLGEFTEVFAQMSQRSEEEQNEAIPPTTENFCGSTEQTSATNSLLGPPYSKSRRSGGSRQRKSPA